MDQKKRLLLLVCPLLAVSAVIAWFGCVWLALPFGLLFSIIAPGVLSLLILKREIKLDWESCLLIVGLGTASLIFTSLLSNFIFQLIGITRPLTPALTFLAIGITNILMLLCGFSRWSSNPIKLPKISYSKLDLLTIVSPIVLLLGFAAGAIRLNNGASGGLTLGCYLFSTLLIVWLFVQHKKLRVATVIWALWLTALGILISSWLRSDYVIGMDVVKEFQIFELIKHSGYWSIALYRNAYTACLSVSLLPVDLSYLTKLPDSLIFKLLLPAIYSLIVPIVFLIARTQTKVRGAIIATFFFFAQPPFTIWWWIPIRQEVAFLFLGLLILTFINEIESTASKILFLIFGLSMVVSHYSTSYIAIAILLIFYLVNIPLKRINRNNGSKVTNLRFTYILILLLFTFFWYSQATTGFSGVTQFTSKSIHNISSLFSSDVQQQGQTPLSHFNIFSSAGTAPINPIQYAAQQSKEAKTQYDASNLYETTYGFEPPSYIPIDSHQSQVLNFTRNILKVMGNLLIVFGVMITLFLSCKLKAISKLGVLQLSAFLVFAIALFLPFFSISYGEDRLYIQLLMILAGTLTAFSSIRFLHGKWVTLIEVALLVFVAGYFLVLNQVPQQLTASSQHNIALGNNNEQYFTFYTHHSDVSAAQWLARNDTKNTPIYGDAYSQNRLIAGGGLFLGQIQTGVFPNSIPRNSFVYQDSANTMTGTAFDSDQGPLLYKFPTDFLSAHKNTVYSNSQDIIYR